MMKKIFVLLFGILVFVGIAVALIMTPPQSLVSAVMKHDPILALRLFSHNTTNGFRYKVTVEIETPEGLKTGSAVREMKVTRPSIEVQGLRDTRAFVEGEAVLVDLGNRGVLFAVLDADDYRIVFQTLPGPPGFTPEGFKFYKSIKNKRAVVSADDYPKLVRFKNMNDPKSVQLIYETEYYFGQENGQTIRKKLLHDNFEEIFGKGVKLKQITVETTDEPITWSVKKFLPWLDEYRNKLFDGLTIHTIDSPLPLANSLGAGSFSTAKNSMP